MKAETKLTKSERREIEAALLSEIERIERTSVPLASAGADGESNQWSDTAVNDSTSTSSPAALLQRDGRHQALTDALERLQKGVYGLCVHCGNAIPVGRLLVIPETDYCLGCRSVS